TLAELLRPLFCTIDVGLSNGDNSTQDLKLIPNEFLVDRMFFSRRFEVVAPIQVDNATYQRAMGLMGQFVMDDFGHDTGKTDVVLPFYYPKRSETDVDYVIKLQALYGGNAAAEELIKDVLMVNFTQPIFDKDRCDLVELVADVKAADAPKVADVKKAF